MASSGSFSGSIVSGHYQLRVDWSQAQNVSANKSTITAKIYLVNDWSLSINSRTSSITINGTSQNYSSSSISTTGTHLLATVTQERSTRQRRLQVHCHELRFQYSGDHLRHLLRLHYMLRECHPRYDSSRFLRKHAGSHDGLRGDDLH